MAYSRIFRVLTFAGRVSSFAIRNDLQLNSTASELPRATNVDVLPASLLATDSSSSLTWRPKVHGESSASGFEDATTAGGDSRVYIQITATGFDVTMPTNTAGRGSQNSITVIDIGTIIQSLITTLPAMPTVHYENSVPGWEDATSTVHFESSASSWGAVTSQEAHFESSASGWGHADHQDPSIPQSTRYKPVEVSDDPWTKDLRASQTTVPNGGQVDQPQMTTIPSKTITDFPPPPEITHDGITARPVAVTRRPTVTLSGGILTTTDEVEFQVAIGSSTLSIGTPITINNIVIGVTTDAAGSTVLRAGDMITTLPKPTSGEVRTVPGDTPRRLSIMTAVDDGTTKYVLAGQTLAPGQPVTIGDTPISIATSEGKTVLYVGDKTTTLAATDSDIQTITDWAGVSATSLGTVVKSDSTSADPTSTRSGSAKSRKLDAAFAYCAIGMAVLMIHP